MKKKEMKKEDFNPPAYESIYSHTTFNTSNMQKSESITLYNTKPFFQDNYQNSAPALRNPSINDNLNRISSVNIPTIGYNPQSYINPYADSNYTQNFTPNNFPAFHPISNKFNLNSDYNNFAQAPQCYPIIHEATTTNCEPTVIPTVNFNPSDDALYLKNELHSHNTNNIVKLLIVRSRSQRCQIVTKMSLLYNINFAKEFVKFRTKIPFDMFFKDGIICDCVYIHNAINGGPVSHTCINDVICTKPSEYLRQLSFVYEREYKENLINSLKLKVEEKCFNVLKILLTTNREVAYMPNPDQTMEMLKTIRSNPTPDEIAKVLTLNSYQKISELCFLHKKTSGVSFYVSYIDKMKESSFKEALTIIYDYALDATTCYFNLFTDSIQKNFYGKLIRVAVNRSEIDLLTIVRRFEEKSGRKMSKILDDIFFSECHAIRKFILGVFGCRL